MFYFIFSFELKYLDKEIIKLRGVIVVNPNTEVSRFEEKFTGTSFRN
jgi:hypothetical protein